MRSLPILALGLALGHSLGCGVGADVVQAGLDAKAKQEDEAIRQGVAAQLAEADRLRRAHEAATAACSRIAQLGAGVSARELPALREALAAAGRVERARVVIEARGNPRMPGTSAAGLGAMMGGNYLDSSDPTFRQMGEQQAALKWLEATQWCGKR